MSFPKSVEIEALVKCGRCCCICHKFCGTKIELHHIKQKAYGGADTIDKCIPLCLECHADMGKADPKHPKGKHYSENELRQHRDNWYKFYADHPNAAVDDNDQNPVKSVQSLEIISQAFIPFVELNNIRACPTCIISNKKAMPEKESFTLYKKSSSFTGCINCAMINVDVDSEDTKPIWEKEITFQLCNISDAIIRFVSIDDIEISGYNNHFQSIRCKNHTKGSGFSQIINKGQWLNIYFELFFCNDEIYQCWTNDAGGTAFTIFITTTTVTGLSFHEYIDIRINDIGYSDIKYGDKQYEK